MNPACGRQVAAESTGNTATLLLAKQPQSKCSPESHRVKVAIIGTGNTGVAIGISILFKRLASELVFIDTNENLAKAEAEDISHAAGFIGNPKVVGTKELLDYSYARDAAVCVVTACANSQKGHQNKSSDIDILVDNLNIFKVVIPNICKFARNCILVIVTSPVDILSYAAMKLSGFPPNRVIGLGTCLDSCRFRYFISRKFGVSASSVQALIVGENGAASVPVWSTVSVTGMKLNDINQEIGTRKDPENWTELHAKVVDASDNLFRKKGCSNWGLGICVSEIVDAIVRNTCVCITVSTFLLGCRHGLEKDIFMSLPCIIGKNGVVSYVRHLYSPKEQALIVKSCNSIYEAQKSILNQLD